MTLTVKSIEKRDAGRGIAAIPEHILDERGISRGDHIVMESSANGGKALARAYPGYEKDADKNVVRIDGDLRNQIGVTIDERVEIADADISKARAVKIALPEDFDYKGDLKPHLLDKLSGSPAKPGQTINIQLGFGKLTGGAGQKVTVYFEATKPDGLTAITEATNLSISDKPAEHFTGSVSSNSSSTSSKSQSKTTTRTTTSETPSSGSTESNGITYEDIGGHGEELDRVREMIEMPMQYPEMFQRLGIEPPRGLLLHGPPGTGKTLMAKAVANEVDAEFYNIKGPEVIDSYRGKSEEAIREVFAEATENSPAIIFIDEIDAIAGNRENADHSADERLVNQLLTELDGIEDRGEVVVIGATNRPDSIDNALRRGGRFDREIEIGVPDKDGREEILEIHTRNMPLREIHIEKIAEETHGFVGADLNALTKEAAMNAVRRLRPHINLERDTLDASLLNSLEVYDEDFDRALDEVEPSAMREVFVEVPDVEWDDVGGLEDTKQEIQEVVQWPLEYDFLFDEADIDGSSGVLLSGPPGTGKTLLAKAVANESDANFISVDGPEVMSKWVGEAEERIREVFDKARSNAPAVIFFDELDSIAGQRGGSGSSSNNVTERVVSQMLTELDGMETSKDVVVIATSNRPDLIDDALTRSGRFDRQITIPIPDKDARKKVFDVHIDGKPVESTIDTDWLADESEGLVGADIEAVCKEASMLAMRDFVANNPEEGLEDRVGEFSVHKKHFENALEKVEPSVDEDTLRDYGLDDSTDINQPSPFER